MQKDIAHAYNRYRGSNKIFISKILLQCIVAHQQIVIMIVVVKSKRVVSSSIVLVQAKHDALSDASIFNQWAAQDIFVPDDLDIEWWEITFNAEVS